MSEYHKPEIVAEFDMGDLQPKIEAWMEAWQEFQEALHAVAVYAVPLLRRWFDEVRLAIGQFYITMQRVSFEMLLIDRFRLCPKVAHLIAWSVPARALPPPRYLFRLCKEVVDDREIEVEAQGVDH